jgi:hypothetical protein
MMWVFEGIELGKWTKRKTFANRTPSSHFRRFKLSLMSCSPAELISVSIEQSKFQFNQLYLQTVKKGNHLPPEECLEQNAQHVYVLRMHGLIFHERL